MATTQSEVEEFLAQARELIEKGQIVFVPRQVNLDALRTLGQTQSEAWAKIARLTINNYHNGPDEDRDRATTFVWIFGASVEKQPLYIKLKIEEQPDGKLLKCLSFHPAQFALNFPLRPLP